MIDVELENEKNLRNATQELRLTLVGRDPEVELAMIYVMCSIIARKVYQLKKDSLADDGSVSKLCTVLAANISNWGMLNTSTSKIASILREFILELRDFFNISISKPGCLCMQSFGIGHYMGREMLNKVDSNEEVIAIIDRNMKYLIRQDKFLTDMLELKI